ncbi:hypothetical protein ACYCAX_18445 [Pseudomonas sp. MT3]|uniref:hypothetical protein n=1 Tax=Pseudomonas sp. ATCC 13867 TaxID=1294143 RepID=UPI0012FEF699|nr:hypothetical protein [Pseudomonas sp. ATCC 13867]
MTKEKKTADGTSDSVETAGNPPAIAQRYASGGTARKTGVNIYEFPNRFYRACGSVAKGIYPSLRSSTGFALPVELQKHQSRFPLSQKLQLRSVSEVFSPALARAVPFTHPVPAMTEHPKRVTGFRRERAPLTGRSSRHHDESRAARCARAR